MTKARQVAVVGWLLALFASTGEPSPAVTAPVDTTPAQPAETVRILSWNVSGDAFARHPAAFRALASRANAHLLLLDEVAPSTTETEIREALPAPPSEGQGWDDIGASGGRQRDVIASHLPLERRPEFSGIVAYPAAERDRIQGRMAAANELRPAVGPYPRPHASLIAAELRHLDGSETWTWDGRGTPFPSSPLDLVLYSPHSLRLRGGYVLDSADLPPADRERLGLEPESASRVSRHLPLVADFDWQSPTSVIDDDEP